MSRCISNATMAKNSEEIIKDGAPWRFRGEGNSSLVLASSSSQLVLRLRKMRRSHSKDGPMAMNDAQSSLQGIVDYVDHVIRPMLPCSAWIPRMRVLQLPHDWNRLVEAAQADRDTARLLDEHSLHHEAILMRDLCFSAGF